MVQHSIVRLQYLCESIPSLLSAIAEKEFLFRPEGKWSKKEILGHLIDSASNNHQRFVRVQFEHEPVIAYDADQWNSHGYYQAADSTQLIHFWNSYNKQLAHLMKNIPETNYTRLCKVGEQKVSLEFLMTDYVVHLEHHLHQLVDYV